ncbi:RDD family protein [Oceanobacillus sp. CF4.6]|uniref:RDD family protein n=1 Tax=Oceanobacillus sp. CF4.6 TaxID=3373080 RepID=UPI003EE48AB1
MSKEVNPRLKEWQDKYHGKDISQEYVHAQSYNMDKVGQTVRLESQQFVGFWRRTFAYIVDSILLSLFFYIFSMEGFWPTFLIGAIYYTTLTSSSIQGTIGKVLIGAKVTDKHGNQISFGHSVGRFFAYFLSGIILFLGFIMVAFNGKKQGLHDLICQTYVINKN